MPSAAIEEVDAILGSPAGRDSSFLNWVDTWAARWTTEEARPWMAEELEAMSLYAAFVDSSIAAADLPPSLRYLPMIESGYRPAAVSQASAVGLWQFMAPTARSYGLEVTPLVDERRDPFAATAAALEYLAYLSEEFDSWFLALAAYNAGPGRIEGLLRDHASGATGADSLYLTLRPHLPSETRDFVSRFFAAARVGGDPAGFGLSVEERGPLQFDEVTVPDATSLDVVARAAGVEESDVLRLNPHVVRRVTPRGRETKLRVPRGSASQFYVSYPDIPENERITITDHTVAEGETLWGISRQYGIALDALRAANPGIEARRLRPGRRLLVPLLPRDGDTGDVAVSLPDDVVLHVVRPGDNLWDLSRRYQVRVEDLQRWNGLEAGAFIQPGQRLRVSGG